MLRGGRARGRRWGVLLLAAGLAAGARADRVVLRNGRVLEGVVEEQTPEHVLLRMVGTRLTLEASRVKSVELSADAEREEMREEMARAELPPPPFPEALKPLRAEVDRLGALRGPALQAADALKRSAHNEPVLEQQHKAALDRYRGLQDQLSAMQPSRRSRGYNEKVEQVNQAAAEANRIQEQVETLREQQPVWRERIASYSALLAQVGAAVEERRKATEDSATFDVEWLQSVSEKLAAWEQDFDLLHVPVRHDGRSTLVTARINGRLDGTFLVDTGASVVTLTETLAQRLQLAYDRGSPIQITLADGSKVPGYSVLLQSVSVGEAKVENVQAVVMSKPPGPGMDGLLGMSFLREFSMRHEGASNTLELKRLTGERK